MNESKDEDKVNWIQIKEDTDKLTLNQIKETIIESISCAKYNNEWEKEKEIEFSELEINSSSSQCESQNAEEISEDINQSLLDWLKRANLIYKKMLWIHKANQYERFSFNKICQK